MNQNDSKIWNKVYHSSFKTLLASWDKLGPFEEIAKNAAQAADAFFWGRYARILSKYEDFEALRRIMELDGTSGRCIDFMLQQAGYYLDSPSPLEGYAKDNVLYPKSTAGQQAIMRYLRKEIAA